MEQEFTKHNPKKKKIQKLTKLHLNVPINKWTKDKAVVMWPKTWGKSVKERERERKGTSGNGQQERWGRSDDERERKIKKD